MSEEGASLYYRGDGVALYLGDAVHALANAEQWPVETVVSALPYWLFHEDRALIDSRDWSIESEAHVYSRLVRWIAVWMPFVAQMLAKTSAGRAWFLTHQTYVGPLLRVACLIRWSTPAIWTAAGRSVALVEIGEPIAPKTYTEIGALLCTCDNPLESMPLLDRILRASADSGVLDPFCGTGRTLVAARALGRECVGVDIRVDALAAAVGRLTRTAARERVCA